MPVLPVHELGNSLGKLAPIGLRETCEAFSVRAAIDGPLAARYEPPRVATERPPETDERDRDQPRLERLIPELIRRLIEAGYEKLSEGPENVRQRMSDLKLPKEALGVLFGQLDDTKNGVYRVVAREVRDFLNQTNFAEELARVLTTLSFEIKTEVRFIPNDSKLRASPEVRTKVGVRRDRSSQPPPEAGAQPADATPTTPATPKPSPEEKAD